MYSIVFEQNVFNRIKRWMLSSLTQYEEVVWSVWSVGPVESVGSAGSVGFVGSGRDEDAVVVVVTV